jgi:hypothetical protein
MKLGNLVRDTVTGFEGIAVSEVKYINGCRQFCIQPKAGADGKFPEGQYIDHQRLEVIGDGVALPSSDTGGVMSNTPSANYRG